MAVYIHQLKGWPDFFWDQGKIAVKLAAVRHRQGRLLGRMESMGTGWQAEAHLRTLTLDVLAAGEMEGQVLDPESVRSVIARRLGMDVAGPAPGDCADPADHTAEAIVDVMLDATRHYHAPLTRKRILGWHAALFPAHGTGAGVGDMVDPMRVGSHPSGRGKVHFQAPHAELPEEKMTRLLIGFNRKDVLDPVVKAAIVHWWFMTIRPFEAGNGRIAGAIMDMQLSRADQTAQRFYSMSSQIKTKRDEYYSLLERTQKNSPDLTVWLDWFLDCLDAAITSTDKTLAGVLRKSRFWERHLSVPLNDRQRLMLDRLLDGWEGRLTSSVWAAITASSQDTAGRDINDLVQRGVLRKEPAGGRSTSYLLVGTGD